MIKRLVLFCLLFIITLLAIALLGNYALAWVYSYSLTHPGCNQPTPLREVEPPLEVWLPVDDSLELRAWYYPSHNHAAIITAGGAQGALGRRLPPVDFLVEQGFGVLQIDSRACGRPPQPVTLGGREAQDVLAGVVFLSQRPEVTKIAAMGFSMGGVATVLAAARDSSILAVVDEGGFYNLGEDIVESTTPMNPFSRLFLHNIAWFFRIQTGIDPWDISPVDEVAQITPRPLLLIYGEHEAQSGRAELQFQAAGEPKELWIVPQSGHGEPYLLAGDEYRAKILNFYSYYLLEVGKLPESSSSP